MRASLFIAFVLLGAVPAWAADEPSGCDKFKWNIDHERAALTAPDRVKLASGAELAAVPSTGMTLSLTTPAEARLPTPPERAPKEGTFAGFISFKSAKAGIYTVSMPAGAWIDLVQDGKSVLSTAHAPGPACTGIRKTVQFPLQPGKYVLQISGNADPSIAVMISTVS